MRLAGFIGMICFSVILLTRDVVAQGDITGIIEKANALIAIGEFDSAYHLLRTWPDTAHLSKEGRLRLALSKTICAIAARRGKQTREAMATLDYLIKNTPADIIQNPEYQLTLSEIYFKQGKNPEGCSSLKSINASGIPSSSNLYIRYCYLNGLCYAGQKADSAIAYLQKALDKLLEKDEPPSWLEAKIRHMLGNILRDQDPEASVQYYLREAEILEKLFASGHLETAGAYYNAANVYYSLLNYTQALKEYKKAYPGFSKRYQAGDRYMRFINEAIGDMFWELGQKDSALVYYDRSVIGEDPVNHDLGERMNASGDSLLKSGLSDEALKYYQSALAFRKEQFGPDHSLTGACNNFIARVYLRNGHTEEAMRIYQQSLSGFSIDFADTSIYANPSLSKIQLGSESLAIEALLAKAEGFVKRYDQFKRAKDMDAAQQTINLCMELVERSRSFPLTEGSRMFRSDAAHPLYALAVHLDLLAYHDSKDENHLQSAFEAHEKSKAYTLVQAMQYDAKGYRDLPAHLLDQEKAIKQAIADYTGKIIREEKRCEESRDKKLTLWKNQLDKLYSEYTTLLLQVRKDYPAYYAMRHSMDVVSLPGLQEIITDETLVLSLFQGDGILTFFAISRDAVMAREYAIDDSFFNRAELLLRMLKAPDSAQPSQAESWQEICSDIYNTYFTDVVNTFPGMKKIIVLPDGVLAYLPFEIFFTANQDNPNQTFHLVQNYAISYAPSATVLSQSMHIPTDAFSSFTGIAPHYGGHQDIAIRGSNGLKYNTSEVNQLASLFRLPHVYTGDITHELFLEKCASAEILHLAMHAEIDPLEPMLSAFLLGDGEDQKVFAYEIQSLPLHARHAVLSACNTGIGQLRKGEGMMSLSRCFQYAGCQSMVVSLWPVDDQATSELMQHYYTHLLEGLPKDIALQKAKMDYLRSADPATSHPYYWAGFVLIGNTDPLKPAHTLPWWIWILAGAAFSLGLYNWRKYFFSAST